MLINWFTVVAQAINFLILVWLLKRFLYKPILHAIDEREKGIATQLAQAEAKEAEAQKERDDFQHKNEAFDQERAALLKKATDEAKAERQRLLDEARKDADALRAKRQDALRKRTTQPESRDHPLDPEGSLCHHAEDAGGPRRHEPRGTHGRRIRPPRACARPARPRSSWRPPSRRRTTR